VHRFRLHFFNYTICSIRAGKVLKKIISYGLFQQPANIDLDNASSDAIYFKQATNFSL